MFSNISIQLPTDYSYLKTVIKKITECCKDLNQKDDMLKGLSHEMDLLLRTCMVSSRPK
jgi:hypothetical protein